MSIFSSQSLSIGGQYTDRGFEVQIGDRSYTIHYEKGVMDKVPLLLKEILTDHITVATTLHLPTILKQDRVAYRTRRPLLENQFIVNFLKDIPSCTEIDGSSTDDAVRNFLNLELQYDPDPIRLPTETGAFRGEQSIVALSFGKDSLLSYALAEELGLNPEIAYIVEQSLTYEEKHKRILAEEFAQEFGKRLQVITHETGKLRDYQYLGLEKSEFGWGLQNTEYTLLLLPLAYAHGGRYVIFGNEQSTRGTYYDADHLWKVTPAFDQTHEWTVHLDAASRILTSGSVGVTSLIEPLMDMMIQRMLIMRYPQYAKYQMSCFTEDEFGRDYRWCHKCSVCAKMYLLCVGSGLDPKLIGFRESMLKQEDISHFTLFGGNSELPYANTSMARDEQLFAFYCAARKGSGEPLVERFRTMELCAEAEEREEELFRIFCSIYPSISIPTELQTELYQIFEEEISTFEI